MKKLNKKLKEILLKMNKEATENLEEAYKFVYVCSRCKTKYGSDKEEKNIHLCPNCEAKIK